MTQQDPYRGGPPAYPPSWGRPTNTLAVLSLVLAFVFPPAGVVVGIIARRQIRRTGEDGDGLALAGIIVGSVATAFYGALFGIWLWALSSLSVGP